MFVFFFEEMWLRREAHKDGRTYVQKAKEVHGCEEIHAQL